jgi:hypothetical protein
MKSIYILFIFLLSISACQKSTDLDYGVFASWQISSLGKNWEAKSVTKQTDGYFSCIKDTSIQFFFSSLPLSLGKYHIVSEFKASSKTLGNRDIAVEYNVGTSQVYLSIDGTDSASVVVTDKGFYHIYIPSSKVVHYNNGNASDTTIANGDISVPDK